jgi:hypothetical protein
MWQATALPTILDGERCLIDPGSGAHSYRLMHQMRMRWPDEASLMFLAFELLHQDAVDLRGLPYRNASAICIGCAPNRGCRFMREVPTFQNGTLLLDHCSKFGFEGVVSERLASRNSTRPSRNRIKTKCPGWKRVNAERHRLFEGPGKTELMEAETTLARKRLELARVIERLRAPGLRQGIARELRSHVAILEREIVELEQV